MKSGGVSVKGKLHARNQDSFWCSAGGNEGAVAVSDGLGSKKTSEYGSQTFCRCIKDIWNVPPDEFNAAMADPQKLCGEINELWLSNLEKDGNSPESCCATALFAFARSGLLTMAAAGDGFIAAFADGNVELLMDDKEDRFANETDCLCPQPEDTVWRIKQFRYTTLQAIIACTDGIEINPPHADTLKQFTEDLYSSYAPMEPDAVLDDIREWISQWPGSDDKTIAYCIEDKTNEPN